MLRHDFKVNHTLLPERAAAESALEKHMAVHGNEPEMIACIPMTESTRKKKKKILHAISNLYV